MKELRFKYSALFQNVEIRLFATDMGGDKKIITADADIKLPILKKSYTTITEINSSGWVAQTPLHEKGTKGWRVERKQSHGDALDPISFFLHLDQFDWTQETVRMAIGDKVVELSVSKLVNGYQIQRQDKEQKLIVKKDHTGITSLEIPVPVIGNLIIKRV